MNIRSKIRSLTGRGIPISATILSVLLAGGLIFGSFLQKTKADLISDDLSIVLNQERLALLGENTLIPISNPSYPEPKVIKKLSVVITAYSSTLWETDEDPYITAAGTWVREGIVANNYFPFGTKIRIPEIYGDRIFIVEDRMNWKKGNYHFDIWFSSHQAAENFGAKRTFIEVLEG